MFTGIIERVGTVLEVEAREDTRLARIEAGADFVGGISPGASISVDGACLTATEVSGDSFRVEIIGTTLERTVAGGYEVGSRVNLERAVPVGGRLEGHLVQGHVDGVGTLTTVRPSGGFRMMEFRIPQDVHAQTVPRGSIALNGVSLTVSDMEEPDRLQVGIVGHTWEHTNLGTLAPGDPVNVEGDLMAKYVGKLLRRFRPEGGDASDA